MKSVCIFITLLLCLYSCSSETTTITLVADQETEIEIYGPIDGLPNSRVITKYLYLEPNVPIECEFDVKDIGFLKLTNKNISKSYQLLLTEGSSLTISYTDTQLNLDGDNAEGIENFYVEFITKGLGYHYIPFQSAMELSIKDSINFTLLDEKLVECSRNLIYPEWLAELHRAKKVDDAFYEHCTMTLEYANINQLADLYEMTLRTFIKDYKPTPSERKELFRRFDSISENPLRHKPNSSKYIFNHAMDYYISKYYRMNDEEKQQLTAKYDVSAFGKYIGLMLAPEYIQFSELSGQAVFEFQNGVGALYNEKFLEWFQNKFENTEYAKILTKLWSEKQKDGSKKAKAMLLERETIKSFEDLANTKELKGKRLYIDLWASWCSPCLAQFKYNEQTYQLLSKYSDVETVYISIDEDENNETWKRQIDFHQLHGYHLRTSKEFINYLSKMLYNGESVSVPRYLLIDKDGQILNYNLPRPSQSEELKRQLDKVL